MTQDTGRNWTEQNKQATWNPWWGSQLDSHPNSSRNTIRNLDVEVRQESGWHQRHLPPLTWYKHTLLSFPTQALQWSCFIFSPCSRCCCIYRNALLCLGSFFFVCLSFIYIQIEWENSFFMKLCSSVWAKATQVTNNEKTFLAILPQLVGV